MDEFKILANAMESRQCYEIVEAVAFQKNLSDTGEAIWALLAEWYEQDPTSNSADPELIAMRADQKYPLHAKELNAVLASLEGKASPANFTHVLAEGRRKALRQDIIMFLADEKDGEAGDAWREFESLDELEAGEDGTLLGTSPAGLVAEVTDGECVPLAPASLNEHLLGGPLLGMHVMLFGRPEVGKSLYAMNCIAAAATAGYRCGFWENEDSILSTQLRMAQALVSATPDELRNPDARVERLLRKRGWYDRIFFRDSSAGTLAEIRAWIKKHKLQVCVINQLSNLDVRKSDNRTLELGSLAVGARRIAKETGCTVISVHQAGESGDNKRVLKMGDLNWSNTDVQAALDILIGVGADDDMLQRDRRLLSLVKNKRTGIHTNVPSRVDLHRGTVS